MSLTRPPRAALMAGAACLTLTAACSQPTPAPTTGGGSATFSPTEALQLRPALGLTTAQDAATRAAQGLTGDDTLVIAFDPASIPVSADATVSPAACGPSLVAPRPNSYSCTTEAGATYDPCFETSTGVLGCSPDPVAGRWGAVVSVTGRLPETRAPSLDPIVFFVSLGSAYPVCERIEPQRPLGDESVSFQCKAPGAVLVGDLDTSASPWLAEYVTTDSAGTTITFGPDDTAVETAWVW